jgi:hypothetical protein
LVAGKEIAVKKYVVKLSAEERDRLEALIHAVNPITRSPPIRLGSSVEPGIAPYPLEFASFL